MPRDAAHKYFSSFGCCFLESIARRRRRRDLLHSRRVSVKREPSAMGIHTSVPVCRTEQRLLRHLAHDASYSQQGDNIVSQVPAEKHNPAPPTHAELIPEDILCHIHSLMPVRDAARAACVSRAFLRSWRCYPQLIFNNQTLGLMNNRWFDHGHADVDSFIIGKIDQVLGNHAGIGVKVLKLELELCSSVSPVIVASHLDRWFGLIVKPGIKQLALQMSEGDGIKQFALQMYESKENKTRYDFPCSLLLHDSLESLSLSFCNFHPTPTPTPTPALGCSTSLRSLDLKSVPISERELKQFLSSCVALENLVLFGCNDIICLKLPRTMQQLQHLQVTGCEMLKVVQINAPKLSTFIYGDTGIQICIADPVQVKHISIGGGIQSSVVFYARTKLQSMMPSVETLNLSTLYEAMNTPMVPSKFLCLKYLNVFFSGSRNPVHCYDFLSMVSFLDASPSLETFILCVDQEGLKNDSILGDSDHEPPPRLRRVPGCCHGSLKDVTINGFTSSKSMVELTVHVLENAPLLERVTLDTVYQDKIFDEVGSCRYMTPYALLEAQRAVEAVRRFVEGKVSSCVEFRVLKPCGKCHSTDGEEQH